MPPKLRDGVLFVAGLYLAVAESLREGEVRFFILALAAMMMGLPAFLGIGEGGALGGWRRNGNGNGNGHRERRAPDDDKSDPPAFARLRWRFV